MGAEDTRAIRDLGAVLAEFIRNEAVAPEAWTPHLADRLLGLLAVKAPGRHAEAIAVAAVARLGLVAEVAQLSMGEAGGFARLAERIHEAAGLATDLGDVALRVWWAAHRGYAEAPRLPEPDPDGVGALRDHLAQVLRQQQTLAGEELEVAVAMALVAGLSDGELARLVDDVAAERSTVPPPVPGLAAAVDKLLAAHHGRLAAVHRRALVLRFRGEPDFREAHLDELIATRARARPVPRDAGARFHETLSSGGWGPGMIVVPSGEFMMGSPAYDADSYDWERPHHAVRVARPFALGVYPVTFDDYDRFARATGRRLPNDQGWGRDRRPVIDVSWNDAEAYVAWLAEATGAPYRLPSEAEWEYAARAGTTSSYHWGDDIGVSRANCAGCGSTWDNAETAPVGSFQANAFGLHDVHGNVWEWVADRWHQDYEDAPADGSAWVSGDGARRVLRGGAWNYDALYLRAPNRLRADPDRRRRGFGFRTARTLSA